MRERATGHNRRHTAHWLRVLGAAVVFASASPLPAGSARESKPTVSPEAAMVSTILRPDANTAARLERGEIMVWFLEPATSRDVSFVGLASTTGTPQRMIEALTTLDGLSRHRPELRAAGGTDVEGWAHADELFVEAEVEDADDCRVGRCDFKLPAAVMETLQRTVPTGEGRATLAAFLQDCVDRYRSGGASRLLPINDKLEALRPGDVLFQLVSRPPLDSLPEIQEAFHRYPGPLPAGVEEQRYWVREHFWRRDVTSLTHALMARTTFAGRPATVHVAMQLHANHYFEGVQVVTGLVERESDAPLLFAWHRVQIDLTRRRMKAVERWLISRNGRKRMERELGLLRERIE